jgi:hypothetical protein
MNQLPLIIPIVFGIIVLLLFFGWWRATNGQKGFLYIAVAWVVIQSILGLRGFYTVAGGPPRILLLAMPPMLGMLILFSNKAGRRFIDALDLRTLTLLHGARILVEGVLYTLFLYKVVPRQLTFEGGNWDILSGLSAPVIYYFAFNGNTMRRWLLLGWNLVCLGLLLNVVVRAVLLIVGAQPGDSPDGSKIAIQYFPYMLLPGFIVPLVLFAHLAALRATLMKSPPLLTAG